MSNLFPNPGPVVRDRGRLAALRRVALLDTPAEAAFDRLTRLASAFVHAPVALVSLVDEDRQFFKSCVGLPDPWGSRRETPLSHSLCQHAVATREPLIVTDAREHPVLKNNLAIPDLNVIAYAGIPLITSDGEALGSFCAIDAVPREWTAGEVAVLSDLAAAAMTEIELRTALAEITTLQGLLPICASCKRIRNERGTWETVETYVMSRTEAEFSHGICPACSTRRCGDPGTAD